MEGDRVDVYWESAQPGEGRRVPRADALSDAPRLSLGGQWRFKLSPTAAGSGDAFVAADFDDSAWDLMTVPSHWVLEEFTPLAGGSARSARGTAEGPLYTNTAYPIPLDPPRVSEENPTADYRLVFDVPAGFTSPVLRFQGVDSCAKVWLNGKELGWSSGSRLPFEFDAPVKSGRNVLAVRVHRWSSGTYLEDQDMWWLPGIFREVELIQRPEEAIDDYFVHADYDPITGTGILRVDATTAGVVDIPELGVHTSTGAVVEVPVEPWSADSPRLYRGTLRSKGETISLAVGFRRVEVSDGVLKVNGRPVMLRGVNRHEHHPDTGRTLDRDTMVQDIVMMKRANIDAVRTSHYPPHPEFMRLCDEYGLWVVLECDLETHGFIYAGWEGNPPSEPAWRDAIMDRMRRTVERDKNHPSVIIWSMANESWTGETFTVLRQWIRDRDPSRPVLYERDPSYRDSDFYSLMYPSLEDLERIGAREEERPEGITPEEDTRRRSLPFLLVEYAHAMGNGPGSLQDYQRIIARYERICGGFVWEWIDHGFNALTSDGTPYVMHGEDVEYEPCGGRFSLHGLVFSDRTPTPGLTELARAYAPVRFTLGDDIEIHNDRHASDTSDLRFTWRVEVDGAPVRVGELKVPVIPAGASVRVALPDQVIDRTANGSVVLTVEAVTAGPTRSAPAGHLVAWEQLELQTAGPLTALQECEGDAIPHFVGPATQSREITVGVGGFDAHTGRLVRLGDLRLDGPWIDLHRAPTENDHGQGHLNDVAEVWAVTGMNRLLHRIDVIESGSDWLRVQGRTAPVTHPHGVDWIMHWKSMEDSLDLHTEVAFSGPWADTPYGHRDIWTPRLGLLFSLPGSYRRATWYGRGPGETYIDSFEGSQIGRYTAGIDALQTPYPVPQENGNHIQTRWLELVGGGLPELEVWGDPFFDFTARRWTSLDLEKATKPHMLRDTGRVWLNLDHAQQGLGSASVGPALPMQYRIARVPTRWSIRLRAR